MKAVFVLIVIPLAFGFPFPFPNIPLPPIPLPPIPLPNIPLPNIPLPPIPLPNIPLPNIPLPKIQWPSIPLPDIPALITQKLVPALKQQVDNIGAQVIGLQQAVQNAVINAQKLDPQIYKDIEDIADRLIDSAAAGVDVGAGVLTIIDGSISKPPSLKEIGSGADEIAQGSKVILKNIIPMMKDVGDIIQRYSKQCVTGEIECLKLEQVGASLKNAENQLQEQIQKIQQSVG